MFDTVQQPYWVEALADYCRDKLDLGDAKVEALKVIHEAWENAHVAFFRRFRFGTIVGALVGILGFLASQIPEETFEELGWPHAYGWYRLAIFGVLVYLLFSVAVGGLRTWPSQRKRLRAMSITGLVLSICATRSRALKSPEGCQY